jgi:Fe-S cluster biogenesis protein NfuA
METPTRLVSIYTEATPNPETMKFVLNKMLYAQNSADFPNREAAEEASPLAIALYNEFDFVNGVFIMNNFVTVTKKPDCEWYEIVGEVREFIRGYISNGGEIVNEAAMQSRHAETAGGDPNAINADDDEVVAKIKEMLTRYVQPAVEMDGGTIVFRSYKDGLVTLGMQGSCSGCPSSTVTLKSGIEGLLKRMVPQVQSVEAEAI